MNEQDPELLAIQLATRVLRKECTIDSGLVRTHAAGALAHFVESLNTLAGGAYFDLELMKARVGEGAASRAISGRGESMPLPPDLEDWSIDKVPHFKSLESLPTQDSQEGTPDLSSSPDENMKGFIVQFTEGLQRLDRKVKELRFQRDEVRRLLLFLENVQEKRSEPPRPWIGSLILLIIAVIVSGVSFLILQSPLFPSVVLIGSAFLAAFLFQREYAWYERLMQIEKTDTEHRNRNMLFHKKQIEEYSNEIHEIRKEALLRILNLEGSEKEKALEIKGEFPALFKEGRG